MSGLLHESNLVMYDRATESLWSQSKGAAIAGDRTGTELGLLLAQNMTVGQLREREPDALILSEDTGHTRDYRRNPYAGYEESEQLIAPVSREDARFPAKTIMYVFRIPDGPAVAVPYDDLPEGTHETDIDGRQVILVHDGITTEVSVDEMSAPGYLEMWFSYVAQHDDDAEVWNPAEPK